MDKQAVETTSCKNCSHEYNGIYCPQCGQKRITSRIKLKDSFRHWLGVMVNFDRGLWHTTWLMYKKPGKVITDYLNGVTRPYLHPFRFLFLWLTVQVFLMFSTGLFDLIQENMATGNLSAKQAEAQAFYNDILQRYMQLFFVLGIPGLAFATKILFSKARYNFAEHLVVNSFAYGASMILGIIMIPIYFAAPNSTSYMQGLAFTINIGYLAYAYKSIFKQNYFVTILKTILALIIWIIAFTLVIVIFVIIYFIITAIVDPDALKKIQEAGAEVLLTF